MLKRTLAQQKIEFEEKTAEPYVTRSLVIDADANDLIKVILGPRRAGKSFLVMHLVKAAGKFGYVNFDDEFLSGFSDTNALMDAVDEVWDSPAHILFDEIQNLPKWELFLNRLQRQGRKLMVTGSNAHLLGSELTTHLTGRHLPYVLFPFSFTEYCAIRRPGAGTTGSGVARQLISYLKDGGFPEPLFKTVDRRFYLSTLLDSLIYKDIVRRFRLRVHTGIQAVARYLMSNVGSEYSHARIAEVSGCKSVRTTEKYIGYLEQAFLFFTLSRFSWKVREQVRTNKKIYCIDNGLVAAGGFSIGTDTGRLAENLVAITLHKKRLQGELDLFFWKNRDHHEVDFLVKQGNGVRRLIQVCWDVSASDVREREIRALLSAGSELKCSDLVVLTENHEAVEQHTWFGKSGEIRFQPLWKWFLEQEKSSTL
ncbi:MAG: ATP-binding protein [Fibrobacterota bacterium]